MIKKSTVFAKPARKIAVLKNHYLEVL